MPPDFERGKSWTGSIAIACNICSTTTALTVRQGLAAIQWSSMATDASIAAIHVHPCHEHASAMEGGGGGGVSVGRGAGKCSPALSRLGKWPTPESTAIIFLTDTCRSFGSGVCWLLLLRLGLLGGSVTPSAASRCVAQRSTPFAGLRAAGRK